MNSQISIIIPLYNNEEFINQCLDSLINQTFKDFEIIIVDDGSTDNSLQITKEYEKNYDFITVLKQKNQYAGIARNLGMKHAKGNYLLFLDSDDFFEKDMLEKIYNQAIKTDADIVLFNGQIYDNKTKKIYNPGFFLKKDFLPTRELFSASDNDIYILQMTLPNPWSKLFKKSYLDHLDIEYPSAPNTEDYYFTTIALAASTKISYIDEIFVNYRINNNKSLQANVGIGKMYIGEFINQIYDELNERKLYYDNIKRSFISSVTLHLVYNINKMQTSSQKIDYYNLELYPILNKIKFFDYELEYFLNKNYRKLLEGIFNGIKWRENLNEFPSTFNSKIIKQSIFKQSPKISIIIYVLNQEEQIIKTLDSLNTSSLKETEIICIDDHSSNKSLDIIIDYAKNDHRLTIIKQDNYGKAAAYNNGLSNAQGDFIYFIEAGDIIKDINLKELNDKYLDVVFIDKELSNKEEINGIKLLNDLIEDNKYISLNNLVINREFLIKNNCFFYPGIKHVEHLFTYNLMILAQKIKVINQSISNKKIIENEIQDFNDVYGYFICFSEMINIYNQLTNINEIYLKNLNVPITNLINKTNIIFNKLPIEQRKIADFIPVERKVVFDNNILVFFNPSLKINRLKVENNEYIIENRSLSNENKKINTRLNKIKNHPLIKTRNKIKKMFKS